MFINYTGITLGIGSSAVEKAPQSLQGSTILHEKLCVAAQTYNCKSFTNLSTFNSHKRTKLDKPLRGPIQLYKTLNKT